MCSSVTIGPKAESSKMKSTPKSLSLRLDLANQRMVLGGGSIALPSTPMPPAFDTAATRSGIETKPIPAPTNGKRTPYSRVSRVSRLRTGRSVALCAVAAAGPPAPGRPHRCQTAPGSLVD